MSGGPQKNRPVPALSLTANSAERYLPGSFITRGNASCGICPDAGMPLATDRPIESDFRQGVTLGATPHN